MPQYILALDQGTTSSRAIIFDKEGLIISVAQKEFTQIFPESGWVEHDANEIWSTQMGVAAEAVTKAGLTIQQIAAIGITNQRETTVVWDKTTGQPVCNAIVWQDRRTADFCDQLKNEGKSDTIKEKTGLIIDAYFSASKLKWILDHMEGVRQKAEKGEICFGTIDSWLVWKLTNGQVHVTDVSNASRTMLCNIHTLEWDSELLEMFDIPESVLPQIRSSSEIYGYTQNILTSVNIPIAGIAGDQQSALFGQMCIRDGMVKNTYGTGCFMLMHTGTKAVPSQNQLLTTVAWQINGVTEYALEGSVFIAGAVVQWLRDGLKIIRTSGDIERLAAEVTDNGGIYVVPAFTGLGAPYWNQYAKGTITGITRSTTSGHIARAALESIAYQTKDVLKAMEADSGIAIRELRVDGGATVNDFLMQFQSDILNCKVNRPMTTETTALGAAYLAGLAIGFWDSRENILNQWKSERIFTPDITENQRKELDKGWHNAVRAALYMTETD
ncbi:MAG: glycerol kinase GlpK [Saprospiraceae bacterium]|nr:glycerol kinase GlpK [Saprospiraceae bacterium]